MLEDNQNSQFGVLIPPQLPVRLNHLTKAPVQNCDELLVAGQIQAGCGKSETATLTLTLRPGVTVLVQGTWLIVSEDERTSLN